jgi:HEAT repeat protein
MSPPTVAKRIFHWIIVSALVIAVALLAYMRLPVLWGRWFGPKYGGTPLSELLADLNSRDVEKRLSAAQRLGDTEAPEIIPYLIAALKDSDARVRSKSAESLSLIGEENPVVVPALLEALKDPEPDVRSVAAWALHAFEPVDKSTVSALVPLLKDQHAKVRIRTAFALLVLEPQQRSTALPVLLAGLRDPNTEVVLQSVGLVRRLGPEAKEALPHLLNVTKHADYFIRRNAIMAVGSIGPTSKEAVPVLIDALKDTEDFWIPVEAMRALGKIGPPAKEAIPALRSHLTAPERIPRIASAEALMFIAPDEEPAAIPILIDAALNPRDGEGLVNLEAVCRCGPAAKRVIPTLKKWLATEKAIYAAKGLMLIDPMESQDALAVLLTKLKDPVSDNRVAAARALGRVGPTAKAAVPDLLIALKDRKPRVRREVSSALKKIDPEAARKAGVP